MGERERILVLGPSAVEQTERMQTGAMVLLAEGDDLYEWRRRFAAREDVMVSPGNRNEIPWSDGCFTLIVDTSSQPPTAEMYRVLDPVRGRIVT